MNIFLIRLGLFCIFSCIGLQSAASGYWQMRVQYDIRLKMNVEKHQYEVNQRCILYNHSPDTLHRIYFHLYFNAFQPGSDMDMRSRWLPDPDRRVAGKIQHLTKNEIGYIDIEKVAYKNQCLRPVIQGTIGWVNLEPKLLPGDSAVLSFDYIGQVPVQIRRCGRHNSEGIDYSMSQWYIKICQYDEDGWHPNPYIGREFYGIWGDYRVSIEMPSNYIVAATGQWLNPDATEMPKLKTKVWKFSAENVHDFVWAADPDYLKLTHQTQDGITLYAYYQPSVRTDSVWGKLLPIMDEAMQFIQRHYGPYPYPSYSFIQGGDGGMEYPMATLVTGNRNLISLVGVCVHELLHSWFQMILASNESRYPWLDEGFTNYAEVETMNYILRKGLIPGYTENPNEHQSTVENYIEFIKSKLEEPLCTHSDHFSTSVAYGQAAYTKGALFLYSIRHLVGDSLFHTIMLNYYWTWRFRHPGPEDFLRIVEKVSGLEMDWFYEYFVHSVKTVDYSIDTVISGENSKSEIVLKRIGLFPMPVELQITTKDNAVQRFYIPLDLMRGHRSTAKGEVVLPYWPWVRTEYNCTVPIIFKDIQVVEIDPNKWTLDLNRSDNRWPRNVNN